MKILKIENGNGHYRLESDAEWKPIDTIDKNGLLTLLNLFLEKEVEMDSTEEFNLDNQAHSIIYKGIYDKLIALSESKSRFKDESERLYLEEIKKYSS